MGKFIAYNIVLKSLPTGSSAFEYKLDNAFFEKIDSPEVQRGKVNATVQVKKTGEVFELEFQLDGVVQISCNRCLDDMEQSVSRREKLFVKFGKEFSEENNNVVIVPEAEGEINIAWFLFEFIALSIPIKHVHAPGKCNKSMVSRLRKHLTVESGEDESEIVNDLSDGIDELFEGEEETEEKNDPRWDALKNLIENNENDNN